MKRFTDTSIWDKPWFRRLPPRVKELWRYLCERCDAAGVIDPDWEGISFAIGEPVGPGDVALLNGNAVDRGGKLFLPQFVEFQYGKLSRDCRPHDRVFEAIERHGLVQEDLFRTPARKPAPPPPKDPPPTRAGNHKPTLDEIKLLAAKSLLPETEAVKFFNYYESQGWKVGKNPMKSVAHAMGGWKARYEERRTQNGRPANAGFNPNQQMPGADEDPYGALGRSIGVDLAVPGSDRSVGPSEGPPADEPVGPAALSDEPPPE